MNARPQEQDYGVHLFRPIPSISRVSQHWLMDRVIALFSTPGCAERARGSLVQHGFAAGQLELVSLVDRVRVKHLRDQSFAEDLLAYFHPLLRDDRDWPVVDYLIDAIQHGKATLAVRPRGKKQECDCSAFRWLRSAVEGIEDGLVPCRQRGGEHLLAQLRELQRLLCHRFSDRLRMLDANHFPGIRVPERRDDPKQPPVRMQNRTGFQVNFERDFFLHDCEIIVLPVCH